MSKAIFVGSFDIWHNGHEERLCSALKIFPEVLVCVANNSSKNNWFCQEERTEMVCRCVEKFGNRVRVKQAGDKMLYEICHDEQIFNVFRGVKAGRTLDEEIRLKNFTTDMAMQVYGESILFVYDITSDIDYRGSSIIKELATHNVDFSRFVPNLIIGDIVNRAKYYM